MIDYIKIQVIGKDVQRLLNLPFLDFKVEVSEKTGEIFSKKVANYHFCKITIFDNGVILFSGSIHKLYNSIKGKKAPNYKVKRVYKGFNGNDFDLEMIYEIREHLGNLFDCRPENLIFQNIEFGVNLNIPFSPSLVLNGLLLHKGVGYEYKFNGRYAQSKHSRFIFKIYNKGIQYDMNDDILRVELKVTKMKEIEKSGIKTFADINETTLNRMTNLLLSRWNEILLYDSSIRKIELTSFDKQKLNKYSNPRYWKYELKPNHRNRHKKRLLKITLQHSDNIQRQVYQLIKDKCVMINRLPKSIKCVINNSSYIEDIITQTTLVTNKKCLITGIDISMQQMDSFLLSHTGLKHLYRKNRKLFDEVKYRFLYEKYKDADFESQIREIAHCIRDKFRVQSRRYPKHQVKLFNINNYRL